MLLLRNEDLKTDDDDVDEGGGGGREQREKCSREKLISFKYLKSQAHFPNLNFSPLFSHLLVNGMKSKDKTAERQSSSKLLR